MRLPQISLAIVGVDFPNKRGPTRRFELAMCRRGEPVELRPEPNNPADPHAIAVYSCRGIQIGYLSAERAPRIGKIIRQGARIVAILQEHAPQYGVIRVAFDGDAPRLPEPPKSKGSPPDWYPDETWEE